MSDPLFYVNSEESLRIPDAALAELVPHISPVLMAIVGEYYLDAASVKRFFTELLLMGVEVTDIEWRRVRVTEASYSQIVFWRYRFRSNEDAAVPLSQFTPSVDFEEQSRTVIDGVIVSGDVRTDDIFVVRGCKCAVCHDEKQQQPHSERCRCGSCDGIVFCNIENCDHRACREYRNGLAPSRCILHKRPTAHTVGVVALSETKDVCTSCYKKQCRTCTKLHGINTLSRNM